MSATFDLRMATVRSSNDFTDLADAKKEDPLDIDTTTSQAAVTPIDPPAVPAQYRLYKRRWLGLFALFMLNVVAGLSWPWFGPIAPQAATRFNFTQDQVNWLGNVVSLVFLPMSFAVPPLIHRFGIRTVCLAGGVCILVAAWLRYAGTADGLTPSGAYALMLIAQILIGIPQPIYQIIGPKFSETWFDLNFRTTATMLIAIANPLGTALGQLFSPLVEDPKGSVLLLGIIGTVIAPLCLLIQSKPPTPPTYAASTPSIPMLATFRAFVGKQRPGEPALELRERIDFLLLFIVFAVAVGVSGTFSILTGEIFQPYGYSSLVSGLTGAALLLSGIIAAIISAPVLDRVLTHHLSLAIRVLSPMVAAGWVGLIFAVKANDVGGIYVCVVIVGVASLVLLPVALETGCEVTRSPETSSALLWFAGSGLNTALVPAESAMKAGPDADPPYNMHQALVFQGALVASAVVLVFFIRGKQKRRELDEAKSREVAAAIEMRSAATA